MPYIEPEDYRPEQPLRPEITGPMGWEDGSLSWPRRLYRTLSATFAPLETLHAVAHGEVGPALRFALWFAMPFMILWAIIPYTHRLRFGPAFAVEVLHPPGGLSIELDVVRALAIGLVFSAISQLSWMLPFRSLVGAFADGSRSADPGRAAWRTSLYRMWIIPFGLTVFYLVIWGVSEVQGVAELLQLSCLLMPRILILIHCHVMARYFGASGLGALVVSVVPQLVWWAVSLSADQAAILLLPEMPPS